MGHQTPAKNSSWSSQRLHELVLKVPEFRLINRSLFWNKLEGKQWKRNPCSLDDKEDYNARIHQGWLHLSRRRKGWKHIFPKIK
jgi:hypothetical protein